MQPKQATGIARIRQACCLGLPSRSFIPMVIAELRKLVPAACCQFTWSSDSGRLSNFWCDTFMPRRTAWIILHHRQYEADAGTSFRDLVMFGKPTGNLRVWWERGFDRTPTYAAVFEPYGFKWFLDGVVRDAMRPYGVVALIRRHDEPDFSAEEEGVVGQVLPYIAHAMRVEAARPSRFVRGGRSAMLVCNAAGEVEEWSELAHRLATYALVDEINLDAPIAEGDFSQVGVALKDMAAAFSACLEGGPAAGGIPTLVRRNGWGEFVFRAYLLGDGGSGPRRMGILIEQFVPFEAHLLDRINRIDLSARQKEVVLLSAKGLSNAQIAEQMNITALTLKDYFRSIYTRLDISSHQQLLELLSVDPA